MKKISFVLVMLVIFVLPASTEEWISFIESEELKPTYDVISSTNSQVEIAIEIPGMNNIKSPLDEMNFEKED